MIKPVFKKLLEFIFTIVRFAKTKKCWYICGLVLSYVLVGLFFSNFYLQFPILLEIRSPIVKRTVKVEKVKDTPIGVDILPTPTIIPTKVDLVDVIAKLHILESGGGTAGLALDCKAKGLHNEVGYLPSSNFCFRSETEEVTVLKAWFEKRLNTGRTLVDVLCEYNLGKVGLINCQYFQDYLAL